MLDIIITHYREPWEVCRKQFQMLDLQRRVYWSQIRVTVVNDGGYQLPDTELEKLHYPVRQVNIPHGGISAARNAGIDHATGEWIMFCDCDDCFANIYGLEDIQNVLPQATEKYDIMWTKCYEEDSVNNRILLIPMHKTFVFCHGKIYRREFLLKEGIRFREDLPMNEDSCFNAVIIARVDNRRVGEIRSHVPVYTWIRREGSVTAKAEAKDLGAWCQTKRNMIVTEENRLHRPDEYPGMVTRSGYDAFYMVHGNRISASCKQKILGEVAPWLAARMDVFGDVDADTLDKIQGISRFELLDCGEEVEDSHETVRAWVEEIAKGAE